MAPSAVNDSARAVMAAVAKYRNDQAGTLTTGGTSTAYTLTSNQVFASLSAMNGMALRVKFNATNGASPTLNVDGLGAKAINTIAGTAVATSAILANSIHDVVYDNSNSCFVLIGAPFAALGIVSGTVMLFQQTAAPSGWTKLTTNDNAALRVVSGTASTGGSTGFTSVFTSRTIAQANLPNVTLTTTISDPGHTHTYFTFADNGTQGGLAAGGAASCQQPGDNSSASSGAAFTGITASTSLGGSGTAMDFAVKYVDVIAAQRD